MIWDSRGWEGPAEQVEDGNGGKRRDERWRPAGGGDVHVDKRSATGKFGGENRVQQREWNGA